MRQYSLMETRLGKALFACFLFAMLMLARDTLVTSCLVGFQKSQFLMLGILCALALVFLLVNLRLLKQILLDRRIAAMAVTAAVLLLPMLVKRDWQLMYFTILLCPLTAIFLTYFTDVRQVAKYYVVILSVLAFYSLISTFLLRDMVSAGKFTVPGFANSNGWYFYNFKLSYALCWDTWYRNFGIFREPGVYQFFLLLGLFLNNYKVDWKKKAPFWIVNIILAATMVSTFAIGGILELALFSVFLYFDKKWYQTITGKWLGIGALAAAVAAVTGIILIARIPGSEGTFWFNFMDLYIRLFTGSESLFDRLDAIYTNARFFLENPVFGETIAKVLHGTNNNTSSTLILYAVLGIVGGSLNVAAWAALAWEKRRCIFGNLALLVILFMSFNTQNLVADVFFWLFPYMALVEMLLPKITLGRKA